MSVQVAWSWLVSQLTLKEMARWASYPRSTTGSFFEHEDGADETEATPTRRNINWAFIFTRNKLQTAEDKVAQARLRMGKDVFYIGI